MGVLNRVKGFLRRLLGEDSRYEEIQRGQREIQKLLGELQKSAKLQAKAIEEIKKQIDKEFGRRDEWGKAAAETRRAAAGKQVLSLIHI